MKLLVPEDITPAGVLISPPELYAEWTAGSTPQDERRIQNEVVYEAVVTTTDEPEVGVNAAPATWVRIGPSNKMAAFDEKMQTISTRTDGSNLVLRVEVEDAVTALYALGVVGSEVTLRHISSDDTVLREETPDALSYENKASAWDYFFEPWRIRTNFSLLNLLPLPGTRLEIEIAPTGGTASVAALSAGREQTLGLTKTDVTREQVDFSSYDRDEFGNTELIARATAPLRSFAVHVNAAEAPATEAALRSVAGRRVVFIPSDLITDLVIFGFARDWDIQQVVWWNEKNGSPDGYAALDIEIEGVT